MFQNMNQNNILMLHFTMVVKIHSTIDHFLYFSFKVYTECIDMLSMYWIESVYPENIKTKQ